MTLRNTVDTSAKLMVAWLLLAFGSAFGQESAELSMHEQQSIGGHHDMRMSPIDSYISDPTECTSDMEVWDAGMGMCMPLPMAASAL